MPSARAKVTLDYELEIYSLLDGGSELNIMRRRVFERSNPAMDPEIHWRIDLYDSKTNETSMNVARLVFAAMFLLIVALRSNNTFSLLNIATMTLFSAALGNVYRGQRSLTRTMGPYSADQECGRPKNGTVQCS